MRPEELKQISDRIAAEAKAEALKRNAEVTKRILIDVILAVTGWTALDQFVQDAIDRAMSGKPVNISQLKSDIEAWKLLQGGN